MWQRLKNHFGKASIPWFNYRGNYKVNIECAAALFRHRAFSLEAGTARGPCKMTSVQMQARCVFVHGSLQKHPWGHHYYNFSKKRACRPVLSLHQTL